MWPPSLSQVLVMVLFGSILLTGILILLTQAGGYGSNQRKVSAMSSPTPIQLAGMSHGTSVPGYAVNETPTLKASVVAAAAVSTTTPTGAIESQM
ncbi:MAG: hypothetical protein MK036_02245 [Dehalococcoidia bacterium]|nr:hypothetical protein [Dehalococcoidia bacterium]